MRIDELNLNALLTALYDIKKSSYWKYCNKWLSVIEYALDNQLAFNENGNLIGEYRICSECGCEIIEGYCFYDGEFYYCSDECMEGTFTQNDYKELYASGEAYWTQWY